MQNQHAAEQCENHLAALRGFNYRQMSGVVFDQIGGVKKEACGDDAGEQRDAQRLQQLTGGRRAAGQESGKRGDDPKGQGTENHIENALHGVQLWRADRHDLAVAQRVHKGGDQNRHQRHEISCEMMRMEMRHLHDEDADHDQCGQQQIFDGDFLPEQRCQQHSGHDGQLPG